MNDSSYSYCLKNFFFISEKERILISFVGVCIIIAIYRVKFDTRRLFYVTLNGLIL